MSVDVYHADSIEFLRHASGSAPFKFDHCLTDPPYPEHVQGEGKMFGATKGRRVQNVSVGFDVRAPLETFVPPILATVSRWSLFFCDLESLGLFAEVRTEHAEHVRSCLYVKTRAQPQLTADRPGSGAEGIAVYHGREIKKRWNNGGKANVFYACPENRRTAMHPTAKPVMLCATILEAFTDPGDLVFDPFAGAGNVGLACLLTGRRYYGLELNAEHVASAKQKFAEYALSPKTLQDKWERFKTKVRTVPDEDEVGP